MLLRDLKVIDAAIKSVASSTFLVVKTPDNMGLRCLNLNGKNAVVSYFNYRMYYCTTECVVHRANDEYHQSNSLIKKHRHQGEYDPYSSYCFIYNHPLFLTSTWVFHNTKYVVALNSPICSFNHTFIEGTNVRWFAPLCNNRGIYLVKGGLIYRPFSKSLTELLDRLFSLIHVPSDLFVGFDPTNEFVEVSIVNLTNPIYTTGLLGEQVEVRTVADFLTATKACKTAVEQYSELSPKDAWEKAPSGDREWAYRKGYLEVFPEVTY